MSQRFRYPAADTAYSSLYANGEKFEVEGRRAALEHCGKRRRAVDVGAHVGLHSSELAATFLSVDTFEPQVKCYECLIENVSSPFVTHHRAAVGRYAGAAYIRGETSQDSGANVVLTKQEKLTERVAQTSIDSFKWDDVDLIRISTGSEWSGIVLGALQTIERSRPVIWISSRNCPDFASSMLATLTSLGRRGYRCVYSDEMSYVFSAAEFDARSASTVPSSAVEDDDESRLVEIAGFDRKFLLIPAKAGKGRAMPHGNRVRREIVGSGRTLSSSERRAVRSDRGYLSSTIVPVPFAFGSSHSQKIRRFGDGPPNFPVGRAEPVNLTDVFERGLEIAIEPAMIRLRIPGEVALCCDELLVSMADAGKEERFIYRRRMAQLENVDDLEVLFPLEHMTRSLKNISIRILKDSQVILEKSLEHSFGSKHLSSETVNCYLNRGGGGNPAIQALATSLGARTFYAEDGYRPGVSVVWGVLRGSREIVSEAEKRNAFFYYLDHAYFNRGHKKAYRLTKNLFEAGSVRTCPTDRLQELALDVRPWRRGGGAVIVCPPTEYFMKAHRCEGWLSNTLQKITKHTDREIVIRDKPAAGSQVVPLAQALEEAHAVVTHSSNVAIEAAVLGTPVFVEPMSAAAPIGLSDLARIETPVYPDREAWLAHLAYSQFSFEEMKSGVVWSILRDYEGWPLAPALVERPGAQVEEGAPSDGPSMSIWRTLSSAMRK